MDFDKTKYTFKKILYHNKINIDIDIFLKLIFQLIKIIENFTEKKYIKR